MLDALRKASESWFGRGIMAVVLGLIVVSFLIWGIGDIFRGFGNDSLAKVGSRSISTQDFRTAYQRQLNQMQQQARRPITSQEAHAMGLDSQVLANLVADAELNEQARQLGLAMGDSAVAQTVYSDPQFKGPSGQFDQSTFTNLLQQNGLTEPMFVREQRDLYLRREIADAIVGDLPAPDAMLEAVDQFRNETRSVDYFVLTAAAAGNIAPPSDKELQDYFNQRRETWRAPEYRSLVVLALTPASVADPASVTDADAQKLYDANKASYGQPEKRQVLQATYPTQQAADAAAARIKAGGDFAGVAKDANASVVDLGLVLRSDLFDPNIAQAAFSVPENGVSASVKTPFGWALLKATKIQAATVKPFADVVADIKKTIASQRAGDKVSQLRDRIEDQRTSGKTLTQAAQAVGLHTRTIDAVDAQGLDKAGKPIADLVDKDALLKAAFASDVGVDNDIISTPDGGDEWFEVASIDPARDQTLAEVKDVATAAWRQDQVSQKLADKAKAIVSQLNGGASFESIAAAQNAKVVTVTDVKRIGTTDLPAPVVAQVFNLPVDAAGSAAPDAQTRTIFKINDSQTPPVDPDSDVNKGIVMNLRQQMEDDVLGQYLNALQTQDHVSINQTAMASALAGSDQGQQ